jgi:AcrR family transcriptional regulator
MPPRPKLTKEAIVEAAFTHVRRSGWDGLTARYLAERLNTSTKPIYFHFDSMKTIEEMVVKRAMDVVLAYISTSRSGDPWIDQAVGVVLFALEEKHLFRAIFDEKQVAVRRKYSAGIWQLGAKQLAGYPLFEGLSENQVEMIRRARWLFTHGLASLMNISNWPWRKEREPLLVEIVQRLSRAVYNEFKEDPDPLLSGKHFQYPSEPEKG